MALGDDGDFRMVGFRQVMRFPPQDVLGGTGSVLSRDFTTPFGGNIQQPGSWSTNNYYNNNNFNQYTNNNIFNNNITNNYNNYNDCDACGAGGSGGGTITVIGDDGTGTIVTYTSINTIDFIGSGLVGVTSPGTGSVEVEYQDTGGGGGGSTLVYGKITTAVRITTGIARWEYTVSLYGGGSVTAYNLFEYENTNALAYGLTINPAGSDQISGTSYAIQPVPNDTWVALEDTNGVNGVSDYWFGAPNIITGSCP